MLLQVFGFLVWIVSLIFWAVIFECFFGVLDFRRILKEFIKLEINICAWNILNNGMRV